MFITREGNDTIRREIAPGKKNTLLSAPKNPLVENLKSVAMIFKNILKLNRGVL